MSGTIEALFDNKDGSGFGVGGLLGLRGGIPKMPSFRVSYLIERYDLFVRNHVLNICEKDILLDVGC